MRILALSGSLRRDSYNTALLRAAAQCVPPGVELVIYEGLGAIPAYDADAETPAPPAVAALREAVAQADALLVATPEYNGSIPGVLKNAIDWVSRPLKTNPARNKPAAVIGASTGAFGAVWAQAECRKVLGLLGMRVVDCEVPVGMAAHRFVDGEVADDDVRSQIADAVGTLVAAASERREALAAA